MFFSSSRQTSIRQLSDNGAKGVEAPSQPGQGTQGYEVIRSENASMDSQKNEIQDKSDRPGLNDAAECSEGKYGGSNGKISPRSSHDEDGSECKCYQFDDNLSLTLDPDFEYEPLDDSKKDFRLLLLLGRASTRGIHIALVHVCAEHPPPFYAISYTWGGRAVSRRIPCHRAYVAQGGPCNPLFAITSTNMGIAISESVYSMLKELQPEDGLLALWVDAICINQKDLVEKSRQVPMMDEIYKASAETIVWIPPPSDKDQIENTVSEIEMLLRYKMEEVEIEICPLKKSGMGLSDEILEGSIADERFSAKDLHVEAILSLLGNEWFTRTWTFQEVVLPLHVNIRYGHRDIPWAYLAKAFSTAVRHLQLCDAKDIYRLAFAFLDVNSYRTWSQKYRRMMEEVVAGRKEPDEELARLSHPLSL